MNRQIILTITLVAIVISSFAQDVRYTQVFTAPLQHNPALMGPNPNLNFTLSYRNQWANIGEGYKTYRFTFMTPVMIQPDNKGKLDLGLSVIGDQAGAFTTIDVGLAVGYNLRLSESGHFASLAIKGSFTQRSLDTDELTFDEQYQLGNFNAGNPTGEQLLNDQVNYGSVGFGLLWYYKPENDSGSVNAFAGVSWHQVNTPNESFTESDGDLPARIASIAGVKIPTQVKLDFMPMLQLTSQGSTQEFGAGLYVDLRATDLLKLRLGSWYRQQNGFAALFGLHVYKFGVMYSYDFPSQDINDVISDANTHEVSLSFGINRVEKKGGRNLWLF